MTDYQMSDAQKSKCQKIIHSSAVGAGAGNLIPIPGTGLAADVVAMTMMTMGLAAVFGGNVAEETARGIAITTMKRTVLKQPIQVLTKELSKFIPILGQAVGPAISIGIIEATGWAIANKMAIEFQNKIGK